DDQQLDPGRGVQGLFKELTDRTILVHAADRLGQQRGHGENLYFWMLLVDTKGDRVCDHDFLDRRVHQLRHRVAGKYSVGRQHPNASRTLATQRLRDANQRAAGRDQVIDDDDVHAIDVADHALLRDDVVLGSALVDKGDRQVEQPGQVAHTFGATDVRRDDHGIRQVQLPDIFDE